MSEFITEGDCVYDLKGAYIGTVDRSNALGYEDSSVRVVLACGHKEEFFLTNLSNEDYIQRTICLKDILKHCQTQK